MTPGRTKRIAKIAELEAAPKLDKRQSERLANLKVQEAVQADMDVFADLCFEALSEACLKNAR